jgi:hypothetical protein
MPNSLQYPPERQRDLQWKWEQPLLLTLASTCALMNTQVDADGTGLLLEALIDTRQSQDLNDDSPRDYGQMDEEDEEDDEDQDDDDGDDEDDDGDDDEDEDDGDDDDEEEEDDDNGDDDDEDEDEDEDDDNGDDDEEDEDE